MKTLAVALTFVVLITGCTSQDHKTLPAGITKSITKWNELVLQMAIEEDGLLTLKGLRSATMMHIAIHDALSSIIGDDTPYAYSARVRGANPIAAVTQAAFTILLDQYPEQSTLLEQTHAEEIANAPEDKSRQTGIDLGEAAAQAILQKRMDDGWNREAEYTWHPMGPGVYAEFNEHSGTPEGFIFGAGWGIATPFALTNHDQFIAPPPPEIESPAYTNAFDEVKEVGALHSATRTSDQTHLAFWWKDFAENSHNRLARKLVIKDQLDPVETARLFAVLNMSIYDAYVSSFYNKFLYNHWRPYTAIRWADHDGNPDTMPDADWTNTHQHSYAFPSYPSAHGTACAAAMTAFANTFGDSYLFAMTTKQVDVAGPFSGKLDMDPPTRSFDRFSDAAMECAMSRVYLGIHFKYDSIEGNTLGKQVGQQVLAKLSKHRQD